MDGPIAPDSRREPATNGANDVTRVLRRALLSRGAEATIFARGAVAASAVAPAIASPFLRLLRRPLPERGKGKMTKFKAVQTFKNLRRQYPNAPKNELSWHLTALAKSDPELVESLSQILADALCDDDPREGREEQSTFRKPS
ncbi:MAG: hypothetical protein C5B58_08595 [Acidobacteria bacterium]|nr:MAG: hypothetical protein C5B58_08595 [Acidobacteriota bacterium]